jgi:hypothetical protein
LGLVGAGAAAAARFAAATAGGGLDVVAGGPPLVAARASAALRSSAAAAWLAGIGDALCGGAAAWRTVPRLQNAFVAQTPTMTPTTWHSATSRHDGGCMVAWALLSHG